jgi:hypothetical protein
MNGNHQLVLVRASKSRGGQWSDDDFDVRLDDASGQVIGRIFRTFIETSERPWFWMITARFPQKPTERGIAVTREEAMTAFRLAWDRTPRDDAEALLAWGKRNIQRN